MERAMRGRRWILTGLGFCLLGALIQFGALPDWMGPADKAYFLGVGVLIVYAFRRTILNLPD